MPGHQILMGAATAALCSVAFWQSPWIAEHTGKGQRLVRRFGLPAALGVLRVLFALGVLFGILLATNVIRPLNW